MSNPKLNKRPGGLSYWCQGCNTTHFINLDPAYGSEVWTWNEDPYKPSFMPSVKVWRDVPANSGNPEAINEDLRRLREENIPLPMKRLTCHAWIRDGMVLFLDDCYHEYAGKRVPLPELPELYRSKQTA